MNEETKQVVDELEEVTILSLQEKIELLCQRAASFELRALRAEMELVNANRGIRRLHQGKKKMRDLERMKESGELASTIKRLHYENDSMMGMMHIVAKAFGAVDGDDMFEIIREGLERMQATNAPPAIEHAE